MKKEPKVIAIFCSDLHLSLTPPPYRSAEPDWFAAMLRPITELKRLQEKHNCPIFCAGDLFDKWYGGPKEHSCELINWAIEHLPYMLCIPGQHDLPEHDIGQIERSAYWTLKKSGIIDTLWSDDIRHVNGCLAVQAFPYGEEVFPCPLKKGDSKGHFRIALIHQYNWIPGAVYSEDAPKNCHVDSSRKEFEGYDLVVSGDNHRPFLVNIGKGNFLNCGGFMIRKSDDGWRPKAWLLDADGQVTFHRLDSSEDKYLDTAEVKQMEQEPEFDLSKLIDGLGKLGTDLIDVQRMFVQAFQGEPDRRRKMLLRAMEK